MKCELCNKNQVKGIGPTRGEFPEPIAVCKECAEELPNIEQDGFPVYHFKSENGFWYFVFIHSQYLYPYFYPSSRPDIKHLNKDKMARIGKMREKEKAICKRVAPYRYNKKYNEDVLFFAYGSEIDKSIFKELKIKYRVIDRAKLFGGKLDFSMECSDGSGKANIIGAPDEEYVEGLLYLIKSYSEFNRMDKYMGVGEEKYQLRKILVHLEDGQPVMAMVYIAVEGKKGLKPNIEDVKHMIKGAKEHKMSKEWIEKIVNIITPHGIKIKGVL